MKQTPPTPDPSPALLAAVRSGDGDAVDAWFRSEHPRVYRLCFGFLADAEEAEDAAQDAMLHLIDNLDAWDEERPYRGWRNAVVLNHCRSRRRKSDARRRAEDAAAEAWEARPLPDPAQETARGEVRDVLRAALARLTPREREVFVLRDLEATPTAEVAAALAIGESSVRSLLTLARRRLRGLLGDRLDPAAGSTGGGA